MNDELIEELKEINSEIGLSTQVLFEIIRIAVEYREKNNLCISDEELFEIIKETMMLYDYCGDFDLKKENSANKKMIKDVYKNRKNLYECFTLAFEKLGYSNNKHL